MMFSQKLIKETKEYMSTLKLVEKPRKVGPEEKTQFNNKYYL